MLSIIALAIVLVTTTRWFWLTYKVRLPDTPKNYIIAWTVGLAIGLLALLKGPVTIAAIVAVILAALLVFLSSTSGQHVGERPIAVGDKLPKFAAPDEHGESFDSESISGNPTILKFFRGHW